MNQPEPTPNQEQILEGISKTIQTLKSTVSTISERGITVTITAEPQIVQIKLPTESASLSQIEKDLPGIINKAINENAKKIQSLLKP